MGCEPQRRAATSFLLPGQAGAAPRSRHAHSTNAKDRSWHFRAPCNSSAQSSSHRFQYKKLNPQISAQKVWKHTSCGLAVAYSTFSSCSAAEQPSRGLWPVSQMPAPHPDKQEAARATPAAWGEQRAADRLCSAQHPHHARTTHSNATRGRAAVTAIAQFAPLSRQTGCQHGSLCPPHP